jgi:lipoprotein signal peptidase
MPLQNPPHTPVRLHAPLRPRKRGRWWRLAAAFLVGFVPVVPLIVLAYVTEHVAGITVALVCLIALGLGVSVRDRPAWVRAVAVPYWLLVAASQVPFAALGRQTGHTYFLAAAVIALSAFLPVSWRRLSRWVLAVSIAILAAAAAGELRDRSLYLSVLAAASGCVASALAALLAERGAFAATRRIALALCVFAGMVNVRAYLAYTIHRPLAAERILSQPGIRAVYDYRKPPFDREMPRQTMFLARVPGGSLYAVGPHDPYQEVVLIEDGQSPRLTRIPIGGRGGDQAVSHEDEPGVLVMAGRSRLYRLGVAPPRIVAAVDLGEKKLPLNMVRYDPKYRRYIVTRAYHPEVYVVDRKTFRLVATLTARPGSCYNDAWVDLETNSLILLGNYLLGSRICFYDLDSLDLRTEIDLPRDLVTLAALDSNGRRLFIATLGRGKILIVDLDTLRVTSEVHSADGVRNLTFDPYRRLLIAANLFSGHLLVYDADSMRTIGRVFVGKLVRWVEVDPEGGRWYATSSAGGFEIDPDLALSGLRAMEGPH